MERALNKRIKQGNSNPFSMPAGCEAFLIHGTAAIQSRSAHGNPTEARNCKKLQAPPPFVYKGSGQRGRDLADDTCVLLNIPPWKGLRAPGLDLVIKS